jgi:hypothetical protein
MLPLEENGQELLEILQNYINDNHRQLKTIATIDKAEDKLIIGAELYENIKCFDKYLNKISRCLYRAKAIVRDFEALAVNFDPLIAKIKPLKFPHKRGQSC